MSHWQIDRLVIEDDFIAARLRDSGTLRQRWRGLAPTGTLAFFGEHVFYRVKQRHFVEIWSIVDAFALGDMR